MRQFGLIGYPLTHSFSKKYFTQKFDEENIKDCNYELFSLGSINVLPDLIKSRPNLAGLNVTIPYKQSVIPYLNSLSEDAAEINAVNVIRIEGNQLIGYNSDTYGFQKSLLELTGDDKIEKALILGTGGASKAVEFVLHNLNIKFQFVSRTAKANAITYKDLDATMLELCTLIINTTPLGTYPNIEEKPDLPYGLLTSKHYLIDLVYNPEVTAFMNAGMQMGCKVKNGMNMLIYQAERAWEIWNQ